MGTGTHESRVNIVGRPRDAMRRGTCGCEALVVSKLTVGLKHECLRTVIADRFIGIGIRLDEFEQASHVVYQLG